MQAAVLVPDTEYTVVAVGLTTIELAVLPVFHKIPLAALVLKVTAEHKQIGLEEGFNEILHNGVMITFP